MIKAKKSLGQNFLTDQNILKKIVEITKINNQSILEVGPGTGNLTSYILKNNPKKIFVIEKDENLASFFTLLLRIIFARCQVPPQSPSQMP